MTCTSSTRATQVMRAQLPNVLSTETRARGNLAYVRPVCYFAAPPPVNARPRRDQGDPLYSRAFRSGFDCKPMTSNHTYRPEIDGLRAIAVLAVLVFHLNPDWAPGGFVGVDVFFVISGFLITSIIVRTQAESRFSFADFYLRRIRRIAPAYFVVVLASLAAGCLLMLPADLKQLAASAGWSAVSLPNVYFWLHLDTGYFATDSNQFPLLHLWSLGVEEQFYLVWPLMLLAGLRWVPRQFQQGLLVLLIAASFTYAHQQALADPSFAYYMLPTRAGELALGGLLATLRPVRDATRSQHPLFEAVALLGLLLIIGSIALLDGNTRFPGWYALPACAGAALIILADSQRHCLLLAPLRSSLLVGIGLISYSLYLWHWPILAFLRYLSVPLHGWTMAGVIALIFVLASLSYWFVERSTRHLRISRFATVMLLAAVPIGIILGLSSLIDRQAERIASMRGQSSAALASKRIATQTAPAYEFKYNCQLPAFDGKVLERPQCVHGRPTTAAPDTLLWGDSHAAHYIGVIASIADANNFRVRNASLSTCPPVWGGDTYGTGVYQSSCTQFRELIQHNIGQYRTVILSSAWSSHLPRGNFRQDMRRTVAALTSSGKQVVLMAEAPAFPSYDRNCEMRQLGRRMVDCKATATRRDSPNPAPSTVFLQELAREYPHTYVLDIHDLLCQKGTCSAYLNGKPVYFDPAHLSMEGSWQVGARLVAKGTPLPPPLRPRP